MKKRIISMLLAVCMVIACTLAITPSVSAEGKLEITADSEVTGAIGDTATVTVKFKNNFSKISAFKIIIKNSAAVKLKSQKNSIVVEENEDFAVVASSEGYEKSGEHKGEYIIPFMIAETGTNTSVNAGNLLVTFGVEIVSTGKLEIAIAAPQYFDDNKYMQSYVAGEDFSADYITVDVKANGSVPHDITYSCDFVSDTGESFKTANSTNAKTDPIADEVYQYISKNTSKKTCTYRCIQLKLTSNAGSDVAYFNADDVQNLYDEIDDEICKEYGYPIGFKETSASTPSKLQFVYVRLNLPKNVYFDADVDNAYFAEGENPLIEMVMRNSSNVVFLGDYKSGIPAGFEIDEDDYSYYLDNSSFDVTAPDECINVLTWKGNGLYNYLTSDTVREHMLDVKGIEAEYLSFKPLDEFKPMGYQLPTTASGIKGFRIDSEIRYAGMKIGDDDIYKSASVDLTPIVYKSDGTVKTSMKNKNVPIPAVYTSISSTYGPAVEKSEGYYFSAVAVKGLDAANLDEGEYIVFKVVNNVTNCFDAITSSAPVYFKYSADGSVEQLTTAPAEFAD